MSKPFCVKKSQEPTAGCTSWIWESAQLLFLARPEVAIGEPAPLPSGLISLSRDNKMEKKQCVRWFVVAFMNRPTPGRRKNRKWMEREFFDVLWCSCHVLWCFFFKIRCSVFVKQPALVSAHSTWLQNWIELNWKVVPRNLTTFLKSCLSRHPACIGDPNLSDLSHPATLKENSKKTSKVNPNIQVILERYDCRTFQSLPAATVCKVRPPGLLSWLLTCLTLVNYGSWGIYHDINDTWLSLIIIYYHS